MGSATADEAETSWNDEGWDEAEFAQSLAAGSASYASDDADFGGSPLMGCDGPGMNIDGTPMVGSVDIHGNPYGVTSSPAHDSFASDSSGSDLFGGDSFGSSWPSSDSFGSSASSDSFGSSW